MDLVEVIGFLFMLSTMELGRVCFRAFAHKIPLSDYVGRVTLPKT